MVMEEVDVVFAAEHDVTATLLLVKHILSPLDCALAVITSPLATLAMVYVHVTPEVAVVVPANTPFL